MSPFLSCAWIAVDAVLLVGSANRALRLAKFGARDFPATLLAHALVAAALFGGWAFSLGYSGVLLPTVLTPALGLTALVLAWLCARRPVRAQIGRSPKWKPWRAIDGGTRLAAVGLAVLFVALAGLSAVSASQVPDDLSYRLPRIGIWLQTGSLATIPADDPRLNYMPVLADLLQWWVTARFDTGFPGVTLISWAGGAIAALATLGAGRLLGLPQFATIAGAALLVLSPPAFAQFFTAQTDLTTTGFLAAGGYFFLRTWRTGKFTWLGGLGIGLAFATKSTPVYLVPAVLALVAWAVWRSRESRRLLSRQALATGLFFTIFAGPKHLQNCLNFGNPVGPRHMVALHAGGREFGGLVTRAGQNLLAWGTHNLDPNSNPPFLRTWMQPLAERAVTGLVSAERGAGVAFVPSRQEGLQAVIRAPGPEADTPAFGVFTVVLGAGAMVWAMRQLSQARARYRRAWGVLALLVVGWFAVMATLAWHPYGYRYACLVLPLLVLLGVAAIVATGRIHRLILVMLVAGQVSWASGALSSRYQYGPWAGREGGSMADYLRLQRDVIRQLPSEAKRVALAPRYQAITAGFFRTGREVEVIFAESKTLGAPRTWERLADHTQADAIVVSSEDIPSAPPPSGWKVRRLEVNGAPQMSFGILYRAFRTGQPD